MAMTPSKSPCPECASRNTRWLQEASRAAFVNYFRCDACGAVWVVGQDPDSTHEVTIRGTVHPVTDFVDAGSRFLTAEIEAGLLFVEMARKAVDGRRREELRQRARASYDAGLKYLPTVTISTWERTRIVAALDAMRRAIDEIPSWGP